MKNGLAKFGKWVYNNKFKSILAWIVILIVFVGSVATMGSNFNTNLKISGVPSTDIQSVLTQQLRK